MRIVIDMQGAQCASRIRGIGRFALQFAKAFAQIARPQHELLLALNGVFDESIDALEQEFAGLLSKAQVRIFRPLSPCHALDEANTWRRRASEALYEKFIASLEPDFLLITSLFEGQGDDAVSSVGQIERQFAVAVVLYDLIPLIQKGHLDFPPRRNWYHHQLDMIRRADLLLAISESAKNEVIDYLPWREDTVTNISCAADARFNTALSASREHQNAKAKEFTEKAFVLYAGSFDQHKNIQRLISAFAKLPDRVRRLHQLVLVHSIDPETHDHLLAFAADQGLEASDLVFPGRVDDDELIRLYSTCALFVLPSLHEGFGLPALEAMACGAPTLASNTSSLPEVVGWGEALFDPLDVDDMARRIERALTDSAFRAALRDRGLRQAQRFSWEATATRALAALENWHSHHAKPNLTPRPATPYRPRLAYFSPVQSARTGSANYTAELLPALSRHYQIDVIVQQDEEISDPWIQGNSSIRSVKWFEDNAHLYDRVLYQFGNSPFHAHMFDLLQRHPGVVVLHDFFLSGAIKWISENENPGFWAQSLLESHGWSALQNWHAEKNKDIIKKTYPCNFPVLQAALGLIVHSDHSRQLADHYYGQGFSSDWQVIKHLRKPAAENNQKQARLALGLDPDVFLVCSFGFLDASKLNHRLLTAWQQSTLAHDTRCRLVFVGQNHGGGYGEEIRKTLRSPALAGRVKISCTDDEATFQQYLQAADIALQLSADPCEETYRTVLDCMNHGLPTIVNAHGSLAELTPDAVLTLPDAFTDAELVAALNSLWQDASARRTLAQRARQTIRREHAPDHCAALYAQAIEGFYAQAQQGVAGMTGTLQRLGAPADPHDLTLLAERVNELYPGKPMAQRQLLFDISELAQRDAKSGIQRVVRSVLHELLENPPQGFRIEAVYATSEHSYRYARRFTARFLGMGDLPLHDEPVDIAVGDVFWAVDWQANIIQQYWPTLAQWRQRGVKVVFTVHDLLPQTQAETTHESMPFAHRRWMEAIAHSDGLMGVSETVMHDVAEWLGAFGPQTGHPVKLGWAHHGADVVRAVEGAEHSGRKPQQALVAIRRHPAFLMVGTLEPRKKQDQALAAFEGLWRQGVKANLVIVGKHGWKTDELAAQLRQHPEKGRHLFWLEGISDEYLEQVYKASVCLIAASKNEGFGLPLIEAAMRGLPIIARDIPVFREVCGDHALYFSGYAPQDLGDAVQRWLALQAQQQVPLPDGIQWMTWAQATDKMLAVVLHDQWQSEWQPRKDLTLVARYWGSDDRLKTAVGVRDGRSLLSTGHAGHLLYGPYLSLPPGHYIAEVQGHIGAEGAGDAWVDVVVELGKVILADALVPEAGNENSIIIRLPFTVTQQSTVEIRMEVTEHSDIQISGLEIRRAGQPGVQALPNDVPPAPMPRQWRYWGSHPKNNTEVGNRVGRQMVATGKTGYLLYGNYIPLPAGHYKVRVQGICKAGSAVSLAQCHMDVAWQKGQERTAPHPLKLTNPAGTQWEAECDLFFDAAVEDAEVRAFVSSGNYFLQITSIWISEMKSIADVVSFIQGKIPMLDTIKCAAPAGNEVTMIQTSDERKYINMLKASEYFNRIYCKSIKIDYYKKVGILIGCYSRHAAFNRIRILHDLMLENYSGWVLYLDADAIVRDTKVDLRKKLSALRSIGKFAWFHNVYLPTDINNYHFSFINDGVFALDLSSKFTRRLIALWNMIYSEFYNHEDFQRSEKWDDLCNDNQSINLIIQHMAGHYGDAFLSGIEFEQFQDCWNGSDFHEAIFFQALRSKHDYESGADEIEDRINSILTAGKAAYSIQEK